VRTTLANVVAGDLRPTAGTVEIDGLNVEEFPARRRPQLGMSRTYQRSRLFAGLTVEENLYLAVLGKEGRRFRLRMGRRDAAYRDRARRAAANVWLEGRLDTPTADLSHGEQRQLELGLATVTEPRVLMLDEPASGLSRGERERLTELLLSLERDVTLLLIDHDMDVALRVAERVVVLDGAAVASRGSAAEVTASPGCEWAASFLGANVVPGRAHGTSVTTGTGLVLTVASEADGPVYVTFPAHAVTLHHDRPGGSARNAWQAELERVDLDGERARVHLAGPLAVRADITRRSADELELRPGLTVWASLKATELTVVT